MKARVLVLALCVWGVAAPLRAQSIFNAAGLGLPIEPLDGRARALGSFGIGLQGAAIVPSDPAAAARVLLPTGVIVAQPSWVDVVKDGSSDHEYFQGTRFPLVAIVYPVYNGALTVHLASVLDQSYSGQRPAEVMLGGDPYQVVDQFVQEGSVSSFAAGYSRMLGRSASLGFSVGRYSGSVSRTLVRDYDAAGVNSVEPYVSGGAWRYSGVSVTGGGSVDVAGIVRLAASGTWSTELKANPTGETQGGARSFSVPLYLRVGASAVLTPGLNISASAIRADWSSLGDEIAEATGTALGYGAGLELSQFRLFGRDAPLRLGYRQSKMPFSLGSDEVSERLLSGGLALVFSQADGVVFATTDVGVERGRRTGAGVTEEFWRGTVSLRLAAF